MAGKNYSDLIVWKKAMDLVENVYRATRQFPKDELYGLTSPLRRAAISVPSNIAEGQGRRAPGDFVRFLAIAHGSLREVETQILIAERLHYFAPMEVTKLLSLSAEVGRLLNGLSNRMLSYRES
ncbi:MAG TPA: four helix bundle protein [Blastocatellia bacterium]|nr:four helix bundle protein [Blastocatellia bacterium]